MNSHFQSSSLQTAIDATDIDMDDLAPAIRAAARVIPVEQTDDILGAHSRTRPDQPVNTQISVCQRRIIGMTLGDRKAASGTCPRHSIVRVRLSCSFPFRIV